MGKITQRVTEKADAWRRIAVKPLTGNKADILVALSNLGRPENDKLKLYTFFDYIVDLKWQEAKARGLVMDSMLQLKDQPVVVVAMPAAVIDMDEFNAGMKAKAGLE